VPADRSVQSSGPLSGLIVCDLSTVLAGPYCTMLLGDLGAEIVKLEPPGGDPTRIYGPPYAGGPEEGHSYAPDDPRADPDYHGESAYYLSVNRNKRGLRLDLRTDHGRAVLRRILERSDVVVENFRAGSFEAMGFTDAELAGINPRLVHLAITGYGTTGPDAARPGFDFIVQAVSGLMSITGQPDAEGGQPTKVGVAIADVATGMLGAVAILAALLARDAPAGQAAGQGQRIDLSLVDSTMAWLINQAANYLIGGIVPGRMGNAHPNITPYETFRCADAEIAVAVGSERQWSRFCEAIGMGELTADPRFATNGLRVVHRDELRTLLVGRLATRAAAAWLDALTDAGVPCGEVRDMAEAFSDPGLAAREMVVEIDHPTVGKVRLPGIPFKLAGTPGSIRRPPPTAGEHTDELLAWLGYGAEQVEALRRAKVV
jgi:crotonobetainyl-CoA:carnitine CoA-transferase CaiB-like acyl-CoA transferase